MGYRRPDIDMIVYRCQRKEVGIMAGISEQEARRREREVVEESLSSALDLGEHVANVNKAGKLRIVLQEGEEESKALVFSQCSYSSESDVLTLKVTRLDRMIAALGEAT
jgi:hypothetical protein